MRKLIHRGFTLIELVVVIVILGMIPWHEVRESRTVASVFIQRTFADPAAGRVAGSVMTGLTVTNSGSCSECSA